jgi:hypothetical protein
MIDEAQDVSVAQLRFVAAIGSGRPDALLFTGDFGQRIFQVPFSWRSLGRRHPGPVGDAAHQLRTSHQIRIQADRLLAKQITDVDGNTEDRRASISVFNGPAPVLRVMGSAAEESAAVGLWLGEGRRGDCAGRDGRAPAIKLVEGPLVSPGPAIPAGVVEVEIALPGTVNGSA